MSYSLAVRLLSTDFDGTIHDDFSDPRIPTALQDWIAPFQARGGIWVINTGREMVGLMEALGRGRFRILPDYIILVEREIYRRDLGIYAPIEPWNSQCTQDHARLFDDVSSGLSLLMRRLNSTYDASFYADTYSPLCAIAQNNLQMDAIQAELEAFCGAVTGLAVVRNDIYVRLSHIGYSKGTALSELGRLIGIGPHQRLAAGDHLNDLPMLRREHAHHLLAPSNALPLVKAQVLKQGGFVATRPAGLGILEGLERLVTA
ncbi:MAG: HAD family phosphatase [Pedosphaera sp.]|nr:HAD family phosphatase [Pedosphaera sp.]